VLCDWVTQINNDDTLANGTYTIKLTATDNASNRDEDRVTVELSNLIITDVSADPVFFDPIQNETTDIIFTVNLDCNVSLTFYERDIQSGSSTLKATPAPEVYKPAGINTLSWNGKDDFSVILPLKYYTFKLVAETDDETRHTEYYPSFHTGTYNQEYGGYIFPTNVISVSHGIEISLDVPYLARTALEIGIIDPEDFSKIIDYDKARATGNYAEFWDMRNEDGILIDADEISIGVRGYPLPPNTVVLETQEDLCKITHLSAESMVISQHYNEVSKIKYTLPLAVGTVTLTLTDPDGSYFRTLSNCPTIAGSHEVLWDGRNDSGNLATTHVDYYFSINSEKDINGVLLTYERVGSIVVKGDFRVDENGNSLGVTLELTETYDEEDNFIGVKSSEK